MQNASFHELTKYSKNKLKPNNTYHVAILFLYFLSLQKLVLMKESCMVYLKLKSISVKFNMSTMQSYLKLFFEEFLYRLTSSVLPRTTFMLFMLANSAKA